MKHLLPTRHLLTLLLTCFMALGAQADPLEYYVSAKTGNDGRNGTSWNSAFKTIKAALQAAESNANTQAKIYLAEGEYDVSEMVKAEMQAFTSCPKKARSCGSWVDIPRQAHKRCLMIHVTATLNGM